MAKPKPIHWQPSMFIAETRCGLATVCVHPKARTYIRENTTCKRCLAAMRRPLLGRRK